MDPKTNFHGGGGNVIFHCGLVDKPVAFIKQAFKKLGIETCINSKDVLIWTIRQSSKVLYQQGPSKTETKRFCIYRRGAKPSEAPDVMDCSSYIQWLYASIGVEIPRLSIEQYEMGEFVGIGDVKTGDLIFKSGKKDYFESEKEAGIGHVGVIVKYDTREPLVYHAVPEKGIVESPIRRFYKGPDDPRFRGVRRIVPMLEEWFTLKVPEPLIEVIKTTQNVRWRVLTSLE